MTARSNTIGIWNRATLRRFLAAAEGHPLQVLWTFAASSGARRSELLSRPLADLASDATKVTGQAASQESHTAPEEDDQ